MPTGFTGLLWGTVPSPAELRSLRLNTSRVVRREGRWITLLRSPEPIDDGAGGKITPPGGPVPQAPQLLWLSFPSMEVSEQYDQQGERFPQPFVLVGTVDDDIREGDRFILDARE